MLVCPFLLINKLINSMHTHRFMNTARVLEAKPNKAQSASDAATAASSVQHQRLHVGPENWLLLASGGGSDTPFREALV